jgi:hypothetical protein
MEAAGKAAWRDFIRNIVRENWDDITAEPANSEDFPGITDDAGLVEFLKRRGEAPR